jgi:hypothetical protein
MASGSATREQGATGGRGAVTGAALVLGAQGLAWFIVGSRLLMHAGRLADPTVSGFAGLAGLVLAVPGGLAVAAGAGIWWRRRRARSLGRVLAVLGCAAGTIAIVLGVASGGPWAILLGFVLALANAGAFLVLRPRRI